MKSNFLYLFLLFGILQSCDDGKQYVRPEEMKKVFLDKAEIQREAAIDWSYETQDNWNNVKEWDCNGELQSPITIPKEDKMSFSGFNNILSLYPALYQYVESSPSLIFKVMGDNFLERNDTTYKFSNLRILSKAEHIFPGDSHIAELVFHLWNLENASLTFVSVMIKIGADSNSAFQLLLNNAEKNDKRSYEINTKDLFPIQLDCYSYVGSASTPPCTENAMRLVMKYPIYISEIQFEQLKKIAPEGARSLQKADKIIVQRDFN